MSDQKKVSKAAVGKSQMKTKKTLNKKNSSESGSRVKENLESLITSISIAKGMLAIVLSKLQSHSIKKSVTSQELEHLRILSLDAMDEIWSAESRLLSLSEKLKNRYQGICLH